MAGIKDKYVVGFIFDTSMQKVLLITKARPKWMAGMLNGVGGRVEDTDASAEAAMSRECGEETGYIPPSEDWRQLFTQTLPLAAVQVTFLYHKVSERAFNAIYALAREVGAYKDMDEPISFQYVMDVMVDVVPLKLAPHVREAVALALH